MVGFPYWFVNHFGGKGLTTSKPEKWCFKHEGKHHPGWASFGWFPYKRQPTKTVSSSQESSRLQPARVKCLFSQFRLLYTILTAHANDRDIQYPYHWNHRKRRSQLETRLICLVPILVFFSSSDWVLCANKVCITWVSTFLDRLQLRHFEIGTRTCKFRFAYMFKLDSHKEVQSSFPKNKSSQW